MNDHRRNKALNIRISAAEMAANRPHPRHVANGDEHKFHIARIDNCDQKKHVPSYLASFTKGMPHNADTGLLDDPADFQKFVKGIDSGDPRDFIDIRLGPLSVQNSAAPPCNVRAWESQGAGNTFDLQGPDAHAVTMPPAPAIGSDELTAEIGEVYIQALLRDVEFTQFSCVEDIVAEPNAQVDETLSLLNELDWFNDQDCCDLTPAEASRKRANLRRQNAFRGITPGDEVGPYISQFLLAGNPGINGSDKELIHRNEGRKPKVDNRGNHREASDGLITYGAITIDQQVRFAKPRKDYMTDWEDWLAVQNGIDQRGLETYDNQPARRFITTPRDLATYVHYDALYESYLNACLLLLGSGVPFDPGVPFQATDSRDHQQGFAHFGGPHILSLVTEVATRALKAVRYQKFNIHRRLRPEALAARFEKKNHLDFDELKKMAEDLKGILGRVKSNHGNYLLPMAFPEGSPMHPSYGAGHATVAGACVTILKAFFDHQHPLDLAVKGDASKAFVARYDDTDCNQPRSYLDIVDVKEEVEVDVKGRIRRIQSNQKSWWVIDQTKLECRKASLTVEGELNKLASNISIGRDWAGVHYFSDYIESLRMGEQIAIGILEEQKLTYGENFSMTVPLFDGGAIRI